MSDDLPYWIALHSVPGMGPAEFRRLVDRFGTAEGVIREANEEDLAGVAGLKAEVARGVLAARGRVEWAARSAADLQKRGVRILRSHEAEFPPPLKGTDDAPVLLYMLGSWQEADRQSVAIVGTTKPSEKGREIALEFAKRLARVGCTIVSGYAHGCDSAGHRGALSAGGRTIFVVPTGIDLFEPRWGYPPLTAICRHGAVISERPPGSPWNGQAAIRRNRLIVGLSRALFIIEARLRGGTMNTLSVAERLERPRFALNYQEPPDSARGNQAAIARGAMPVYTFADIHKIIEAVRKEA